MSLAEAQLATIPPASRGAARRRAFLDAATRVFLDEGFEAASVNEVVRRAGGSLATLYTQFGNKEGLFLAVVEDGCARFVAPMVQAADPARTVAARLQEIGERFLERLMQPDGLAFFRMVIGEGRKFPAITARFMELGPERVRQTVAAYLEARRAPDALDLADAKRAAGYFCDMIRARHHYRALAEADYALDPAALRAHVAETVEFFLRALRR